ncbi:hypothetical protein FACS1894133_0690 [Clostridia bacterium]|nr:hypothetical protein FACS1894133_0100 [Clostridia bacterium]GHU57563.1 hypothetical protein FACS1894133_0690 [Clostridia bacterium]
MNIWTDEQLAAIEAATGGGNIVISAGAGSGKTAVLTEIIARLIADGTPASDIAVVTFTNKAAAELKERVKAAVPQTALIQSDIESAAISTVHALCLNEITDNPARHGLRHGFKPLDEADLALLRANTVSGIIDNLSVTEATATAELIGDTNSLKTALQSCLSHAERAGDIGAYLTRQARLYADPKTFHNEILQDVITQTRAYAKRAVDTCDEMLKIASAKPTVTVIESDLAKLESFLNFNFAQTDAQAVGEVINGISLSRWNSKGEDAETAAVLKKTRDTYVKADIDNIVKLLQTLPSFETSIATLSKNVLIFINVCTRFIRTYEQKKRAMNSIDFSDMEKLFVKANPTRFKYVIVDEFQDSNETQYDIFTRISEQNVIYVGDVKQSIYGFRKADPRVLLKVKSDPNFKPYVLSRNFRSAKPIIDTCNRIFAPLMAGYEPLRYSDDVHTDIRSDVTELALCDNECEYIANRIVELIDSGFPVREKDGTTRPCGFGDFAVLTRKGESHFKSFIETFTARKIPAAVQGMSNYLSLQSVETAVAFITVISNPYDDFALLAVLCGLYDFTPEDLAAVKQKRKPLFTCINFTKDKTCVQNFLKSYRYWRSASENMSVSAFVRRVMDEGVFMPLLCDRGAEANLRQLILYAEKFDNDGSCGGIAEFSNKLRKIKAEGARMREANVQTDSNAVKLMTIHSSKGLEFPIVFVAKTTKRLSSAKSDSRISATHRVTFGEKYLAADLVTQRGRFAVTTSLVNKYASELAEYEEEKRVLYVAATRARDKLIFTGEASGVNNRNTFYKMLEPALVPTYIIPEQNTADADNTIVHERDNAGTTEHTTQEQIVITVPPPKRQIPTKLTATGVGVDKAITFENTDEPSVFPRTPSFFKGTGGKLTGKKRGDAYHKAMELIPFEVVTDARAARNALAGFANAFSKAEFAAIAPAHIAGFFDSPLGKRAVAAAQAGRLVKEFKLCTEMTEADTAAQFDTATDGVPRPFIQGIADLFFYETDDGGDKIVIVDYKTNTNTTADKLAAEYAGQLRVYKRALEEMTGVAVKECYLYSFALGQEILLNV